jgi:4-hydroxy-3-polyprenylbenzoate decarboxylase
LYKNLREYLNALREAEELAVVEAPTSPHLGISKRTDAEAKKPDGGKALLFTNVTGSSFPVATNIFGSPRRICMALGVEHLDQLGRRVRAYLDLQPPASLKETLHLLPMAIELTQFFPRLLRGRRAPCQEVVLRAGRVDLSTLPVLHCWPGDAGPFITLPMVFTKSLETGKRNVGMYRMQVFDRNTTGMHWHIHKDGSHYYNEYCKAGVRMPVAVAIGADPATVYAATAPMPRGMDEMVLAGFIRNKPVRLTRCLTVDLEVPAEAEFVLEGYVDPGELRLEGPFGDHTGYYSLADDYPVFHVTAVTHRRNPVYNATLVGRPPMEDCYLAKATERLFLPMLQTVMPEIRDYWFPWEGVFHNIVVVAIEKEFPGHAQKVMSGLWGQGQMSFCKAIVVVDHTVDPQDGRKVAELLLTQFDPASDITLTKGVLDVLDHSSPYPNFGSKIGIDLTGRFAGEPPRASASLAKRSTATEELIERICERIPAFHSGHALLEYPASPQRRAHRLLALNLDKRAETTVGRIAAPLASLLDGGDVDLVCCFDREIDLTDGSLLLWKLFNNTDPGRDLHLQRGRLIIDATRKGPADGHDREWPEELSFGE